MSEINWDEPEKIRISDIIVGSAAFITWAVIVIDILVQVAN